MKKKIVVTLLACMALCTAAAQQKRIALDELRDKIAGAWLGQMVGNMYGLPFENKFIEKEGNEADFPYGYSKSLAKMEQYDGAFSDDDTDVEYLYLMLMEKYGTPVDRGSAYELIARRVDVPHPRPRVAGQPCRAGADALRIYAPLHGQHGVESPLVSD